MNRSSGWVELRAPTRCGRRHAAAFDARLARVRELVGRMRCGDAAVELARRDGRWHVWIEAGPRTGGGGLLPFFKAVGSLAPDSCGVLDLVGLDEHPVRWVMTRGSVNRAWLPDLHPVGD